MKENLTMLMDLYELTMANGIFYSDQKDVVCYFDMFFRRVPDDGGFAIMAGLSKLIEYFNELKFTKEDIDYLRSLGLFGEEFLEYLANFKFSCDVWAIPEGTPIFPKEPIVTVRGPAIEAFLVETMVLLTVNHQSLIATKANRIVRAANGRAVLEFGARRAHSYDAAILGARSAIIGGCIGTSCVKAAKDFGVKPSGTMAHSWVQLYKDEYTAFKTYAELYPNACTLLVDTYDTLHSGVPNAIRVFSELRDKGIHPKSYGIRIDSGDLAYLSIEARRMLDEAGFEDATISASNDLDEYLIESLKAQGAKINVWGVGTNLITSKDNPSFGGVYKLAAIADENGEFVPKIKKSENIEKVTNPGNKKVYRIYDNDTGKVKADLICLADQVYDVSEELTLFDPNAPWKKITLPGGSYTMRSLHVPVIKQGKTVYTSPSVMEIRDYCNKEKKTLWDGCKRFAFAQLPRVDLSKKLYDMKVELLHNAEN